MSSKLVWKVKPQPYQLAKENESVRLNCEFEYAHNQALQQVTPEKYFVIWYKDGASQNVLSLNDQLAHVNSTSYEISGTYNLIIKNLTRQHSGVYTCQLFQSLDLVASVNLTVLGNNICCLKADCIIYIIHTYFLVHDLIKSKGIKMIICIKLISISGTRI